MTASIEPKVRNSQALKVPGIVLNLRFMNNAVLAGFATRLREVCQDMGLPTDRGLQTRLAEKFNVSPNAARKWVQGLGMPELDTAIAIANWAGVNVNWLLQGVGPKKGDKTDTKGIVLNEAMAAIPPDDRQMVLDFLRYKIERAEGIIAGERMARYLTMIDHFKADMQRKRDKKGGPK
jgi:transcriptional regulator with XRE-family HTH domain